MRKIVLETDDVPCAKIFQESVDALDKSSDPGFYFCYLHRAKEGLRVTNLLLFKNNVKHRIQVNICVNVHSRHRHIITNIAPHYMHLFSVEVFKQTSTKANKFRP